MLEHLTDEQLEKAIQPWLRTQGDITIPDVMRYLQTLMREGRLPEKDKSPEKPA